MVRSLLGAALISLSLLSEPAGAEPPAGSVSSGATPQLPTPGKLAPFEKRLATAKTVKVETEVLGVKLDSSLETAHEKLDPLCDPAHPPKKEEGEAGEEGESGQKVLWELAKTDYSSIYLKTDGEGRVIYILGTLRPGKERLFSKIGEVQKAPIHTESTVAWDVVRPNRPFTRVVAQGAHDQAKTITIFVVKRSGKSELNR